MYRILVVGAGYVGRAVAAYFRSKNQKVWGVVRQERHRDSLEKLGITPLIADITQPGALENLPPAHFVMISLAPDEGTEKAYREIYLQGIGNVLERIRRHPKPSLIVYLSSAGVYGECGGSWVDEAYAPQPQSARQKILFEAETRVLRSGLPAVVLRLAGIYGPGRNWIERLRAGRPAQISWLRKGSLGKLAGRRPEPEGDEYLNMIHRDDVVAAIPVLFNRAEVGTVYLGVDDEPMRRSEFLHWLFSELKASGLESPDLSFEKHQDLEEPVGKRCSNRRLKGLGFSFKYPTYREGYGALIREIYAKS